MCLSVDASAMFWQYGIRYTRCFAGLPGVRGINWHFVYYVGCMMLADIVVEGWVTPPPSLLLPFPCRSLPVGIRVSSHTLTLSNHLYIHLTSFPGGNSLPFHRQEKNVLTVRFESVFVYVSNVYTHTHLCCIFILCERAVLVIRYGT